MDDINLRKKMDEMENKNENKFKILSTYQTITY